MSYLKPQVSFSLNFASLFSVMRDNSSVFFLAETLYGLGKCDSAKIQRLLTAHMNFHQFVLSEARFIESI